MNFVEVNHLWFVLFSVSQGFFSSVFLLITLSSVSLGEKVKYADDFAKVWGVFGSLRSFFADRLPCEVIIRQLALLLSWRGSLL